MRGGVEEGEGVGGALLGSSVWLGSMEQDIRVGNLYQMCAM